MSQGRIGLDLPETVEGLKESELLALRAENAALRAQVERMRVALETIADPKTYEICYDSPITHARAFARAALEEVKG